ncbi:zinc finger protein 609 [Rhinolophus ferrumequinum]|uniref:Zinc finger protein 609 n=1 Tax=Rhinolophus ferrumequinum TaxID=59479 RepID=A0A7J7XSU8_RHIFE|nr:zinc finger protein 609 [Rhinolophus ferrumequinum]
MIGHHPGSVTPPPVTWKCETVGGEANAFVPTVTHLSVRQPQPLTAKGPAAAAKPEQEPIAKAVEAARILQSIAHLPVAPLKMSRPVLPQQIRGKTNPFQTWS